MYKDDYRAALGKLAPSSAWKEDTLRKMHALEEEISAPAPDSAPQPEKAVPFLTKLRRAALPVAAVLAIAILPLTTLRGCGSADGTSGMPSASFEKSADAAPRAMDNGSMAPQEAGVQEESKDSAAPWEDILVGSSAAAPTDGAGTGNDIGADTSGNVGCAPVTHSDLEVTIPADGSTQFVFTQDGGAMGSGGIVVKTPDAAELADGNPTRDLPAEDMPTALPVYRTMTDSGEMYDVLANTASILGETLTEEREGFSAETIPQDALDAGVPWRTPQAFLDTKSKLSLSFHHYTVHYYSYAEKDTLMEAPEGLAGEALVRYYYDNYGAKLQPLENPALETTGDYNFYREYSSDSLWYEAGEPDDTLETRLYNYTFKQIQLLTHAEDNDLSVVNYTVPPEEIGVCSLRTLDEAKQTLLDGGAWIGPAAEPGGYDGAAVNILHWSLAYHVTDLSEILQPVYVFLIDTPDGSKPPFEDGEIGDYKYVTYAYVPALEEAYVNETPFDPFAWKRN